MLLTSAKFQWTWALGSVLGPKPPTVYGSGSLNPTLTRNNPPKIMDLYKETTIKNPKEVGYSGLR